jgi:hypothetical protein
MITYLNISAEPIPDEWLMKRMRNARNDLLAQSDWRVLPDVPNPSAWIVYRQALRDFPETWIPSDIVEFPSSPQ